LFIQQVANREIMEFNLLFSRFQLTFLITFFLYGQPGWLPACQPWRCDAALGSAA
jgi:hypothetical protein